MTEPQVQASGRVEIARCPIHGLHGERTECFVCGGPVEQVPMVPAERYREALRETVDLCNALREYAPALNMAAEKRLRDSLALLEGGSEAEPVCEAPNQPPGP